MVMLMTGLYLCGVFVVGVISWVGVSGVVWQQVVVVVRTSMGVGEATGVVWEIRAVVFEAVLVVDGTVVLACSWADASVVQSMMERMV